MYLTTRFVVHILFQIHYNILVISTKFLWIFQIKSLEPLRTNKHYKHLRQLIALENELTSMSALFNSPFVANHPTTLDLRANNIEMVCLFKSVTFLYTIHIDYLIFFSLISIF